MKTYLNQKKQNLTRQKNIDDLFHLLHVLLITVNSFSLIHLHQISIHFSLALFSLCARWLLFNLCFVQEVFDILNVFKSLHKCSQLRRHVARMIREIFRYDIQYIIYLDICNGYLWITKKKLYMKNKQEAHGSQHSPKEQKAL